MYFNLKLVLLYLALKSINLIVLNEIINEAGTLPDLIA